MIDRPDNINVFILYAEEDGGLKNELENHLSSLHRHGYIDVWHEGLVLPGQDKDAVVSAYLRKAHIILLLVSANFLSPDCYSKYEEDLRHAYERQKQGKVKIIPVILRHCVWQLDLLASLTPLPKDGHPVHSRHWSNPDMAFENITRGLREAADELSGKRKAPSGPPPLKSRPAPQAAKPGPDHVAAQKLINHLFDLMYRFEPNMGAQMAISLVHDSLIERGELASNFKQYNFWRAYEKLDRYHFPIAIHTQKPSGRTYIGNPQQKGEEWIYTLHKIDDLGGIPGQIRIFFARQGGLPKITGISL